MVTWRLIRSLVGVVFTFGGVTSLVAAEPINILDLVHPDSALVLEVQDMERAWSTLNSGQLLQRLRAYQPFQQFFESEAMQKWQRIEERVFKKTGQSLAVRTRSLCSKSMVLSLRLPVNGAPEGVILMETLDEREIPLFIESWDDYEVDTLTTTKSHHGLSYFQRTKERAPKQTLFVATFEKWFALSDHESCIHDVIDRFVGEMDRSNQFGAGSSRGTNLFLRCREQLDPGGELFLHINARPWDQGINELSDYLNLPANITSIWKQISSISSCLRLEQGFVCDTAIEFDESQLSDEWPQIVATASGEPDCPHSLPAEAFLVFGGELELAPVIRYMESHLSPANLAKLSKLRRSAQSLLGGHELLNVVLPPLATKFSGFLVTSSDSQMTNQIVDGVLTSHFDLSKDPNVAGDVGRAADLHLSLTAASRSADHSNIVTVRREQNESLRLEWLSEPVAFPSAFGIKGRQFVIAGSEHFLRQSFETPSDQNTTTHRSDNSRQSFPGASQFVWLDTVQARRLLKLHGSEIVNWLSSVFAEKPDQFARSIESIAAELELIDSLFIALQLESDRIRVRFCGSLDEN